MKSLQILSLLGSILCSAQFFEEENEYGFFQNEQKEGEYSSFFEEPHEYIEPDLGVDNSGQPGDPTGVPIHQPIPILWISGILIGIVFWVKMKS
jgi:hypothetical protein